MTKGMMNGEGFLVDVVGDGPGSGGVPPAPAQAELRAAQAGAPSVAGGNLMTGRAQGTPAGSFARRAAGMRD
jgi:hypothetical protein